ncbi:MAG: DNA mismatch repair endonuclease MutL [Treponema sp.]|nr:DNA mismatch repair endonuclease MutL [Treponema sp.]
MSLKNPVRQLNVEVARKIAAGEVIDRPNAIVRELLDNSIDSGASFITVEINGGGIDKIRIIDDGCGMTKEDLQNCARPHATSKIETETDLLNLTTLGFRGEALSSIAAVSRLSIISGCWKMKASITEDHLMEEVPEIKGTIVQSEGLFENFPARRQFLKRPGSEAVMCKNTFIEKALAHPEIGFRLINDGETKCDLPKYQTLKERFINANSLEQNQDLFFELNSNDYFSNKDFSFNVIIGEPAISRPNKKDISIFINGRRIQEYSLVQAVEYGGQGFFPNGTYPFASVFIKINPKLVDFNIHPAKKEVKFYDSSELHHALSTTIKQFFLKYTKQIFLEDKPADEIREQTYTNHISYTNKYSSLSKTDFRTRYFSNNKSNDINSLAQKAYEAASPSDNYSPAIIDAWEQTDENQQNDAIRFIGSCLGTFLLAEKNNCIYFFDQHAAHERILFDKIMNSQGANQQLLIPYKILTDSKTQDNQIEKLKDRLTQIGFNTTKIKDGEWHITSVPERWTLTEYDLRTMIFVKQVEVEQIIRSIAAMTACKAAIKDGGVLDDETAAKLVEEAFRLEDPHCPHGRPIYTVISREQLFELVKRT